MGALASTHLHVRIIDTILVQKAARVDRDVSPSMPCAAECQHALFQKYFSKSASAPFYIPRAQSYRHRLQRKQNPCHPRQARRSGRLPSKCATPATAPPSQADNIGPRHLDARLGPAPAAVKPLVASASHQYTQHSHEYGPLAQPRVWGHPRAWAGVAGVLHAFAPASSTPQMRSHCFRPDHTPCPCWAWKVVRPS